MSNFNQYFVKKGAGIMVDRFVRGIDLFSEKYKLNIQNWYLRKDPPQPASYYIENSLTASHVVIIEYTVNDKTEVYQTQFEVPKEIDGAFIIEGAYRIATNTLGSDYDCRISMSGTPPYKINFDYNRQYMIEKGVLKIKKINTDLNMQEKVKEVKLGDIDKLLGTEDIELLRLTERQGKKFQIKLDLDYRPEFITEDLIKKCLEFGDDRIKDLVIDKTIESVPQGFMTFLFKNNRGRNCYGVRSKIVSYWQKFGKMPEELNWITLLCLKHWKGTSDASKGGSDVAVPLGINSQNLTALASKIMIPETVAYNTSFADLIDIGDTPINQSSNKINALTVSTHLTDENILFDCLDKNYQKITIDYMDYLNSKVVASEYIDYDTKTIKPDKDGRIEVKHRMKRKMVDKDDYDFLDLPPDYRLSSTVRRVPFINYTDSVRVEMGSSIKNSSRTIIIVKNLIKMLETVE